MEVRAQNESLQKRLINRSLYDNDSKPLNVSKVSPEEEKSMQVLLRSSYHDATLNPPSMTHFTSHTSSLSTESLIDQQPLV